MKTPLLALASLLLWSGLTQAAPTHGETFKDWTTYCEKNEAQGTEQCFSVQNITLTETQQRLLNVAVGHQPQSGQPIVILTLPLGISLPPGVKVQVDKGEAFTFPVERCDSSGCIAVFPLQAGLLTALKRGSQAVVTFFDATRKGIGVPVSLSGFTAGYKALDE